MKYTVLLLSKEDARSYGDPTCWHTVEAADPKMAASLAVWKDISSRIPDDEEDLETATEACAEDLTVTAVFEGDITPVLQNRDGGTMLGEVYRNESKELPTLIGICPTLDRAIEEKLKEK